MKRGDEIVGLDSVAASAREDVADGLQETMTVKCRRSGIDGRDGELGERVRRKLWPVAAGDFGDGEQRTPVVAQSVAQG